MTGMIDAFGTEEQRKRFIPEMIRMKHFGSYCLSEANSGSDAASLVTTATRKGDEWVLNGEKAFISGAGSSHIYLVMARTGGSGSGVRGNWMNCYLGSKGISCFIVTSDAKGMSIGKKESKIGWNSQPTCTVHFDDCRIPLGSMLGGEGEGFRMAMKALDGGRVNIASCSLGAGQAALDAAIEYTKQRVQFNQPLSSFQVTQFKLAEMATQLTAARLMVRNAAMALDSGSSDASYYSAMAKKFASDAAFKVCDEALQMHGGYGYLKDYPVQQWWRDCRVHRILEGTNEIMQVIIAKGLLK